MDDDIFPYDVECLPCPAGQYCPNTGMSSADAYDCDGGVVCESGALDSVGYQGGAGTECEKGYECAAGALHQMPCPEGQYAEDDGMSTCITVPLGYYNNYETFLLIESGSLDTSS
jgi:hypothetical protein